MRVVVTLPSRLLETVASRLLIVPTQICDLLLVKTDSNSVFPQLQPGDGLLVLQPNDFRFSQTAAAAAADAGIHYGEVAVIESPLAAQHGFMVAAGGKAIDLHALAAVLNALAPCPYAWWHVGEAGSAAFLLALLGQLGHTLQNPIDLSCPLPHLAQLASLQQQSGQFAAEYLAASHGEPFTAAFPNRQKALASFLDGTESPARQIARMISMFCPPTSL